MTQPMTRREGGIGGARALRNVIQALATGIPLAPVLRAQLGEPDPRTRQWRCCFHQENTGSLHVYRDRHGRERFHCFGCGADGDLLDFLQQAVHGGDRAQTFDHLQQLAGDGPRSLAASPPRRLLDPADAADAASGPSEDEERRREQAQALWRTTEPIDHRIPLALAYLTERRRIRTWDPDRLRWHPRCPWGAGHQGCIIAPVNHHATGHVVAVWRIWPSLTESMKRGRRMGLGPTWQQHYLDGRPRLDSTRRWPHLAELGRPTADLKA